MMASSGPLNIGEVQLIWKFDFEPYILWCPNGEFLSWNIGVSFHRESQLQQSCYSAL